MTVTSSQADWINLSGAQNAPNIAVIHINDDHIKVELEIYVNDLVTFERLIPDDFFAGTGAEECVGRARSYPSVLGRSPSLPRIFGLPPFLDAGRSQGWPSFGTCPVGECPTPPWDD